MKEYSVGTGYNFVINKHYNTGINVAIEGYKIVSYNYIFSNGGSNYNLTTVSGLEKMEGNVSLSNNTLAYRVISRTGGTQNAFALYVQVYYKKIL